MTTRHSRVLISFSCATSFLIAGWRTWVRCRPLSHAGMRDSRSNMSRLILFGLPAGWMRQSGRTLFANTKLALWSKICDRHLRVSGPASSGHQRRHRPRLLTFCTPLKLFRSPVRELTSSFTLLIALSRSASVNRHRFFRLFLRRNYTAWRKEPTSQPCSWRAIWNRLTNKRYYNSTNYKKSTILE